MVRARLAIRARACLDSADEWPCALRIALPARGTEIGQPIPPFVIRRSSFGRRSWWRPVQLPAWRCVPASRAVQCQRPVAADYLFRVPTDETAQPFHRVRYLAVHPERRPADHDADSPHGSTYRPTAPRVLEAPVSCWLNKGYPSRDVRPLGLDQGDTARPSSARKARGTIVSTPNDTAPSRLLRLGCGVSRVGNYVYCDSDRA